MGPKSWAAIFTATLARSRLDDPRSGGLSKCPSTWFYVRVALRDNPVDPVSIGICGGSYS